MKIQKATVLSGFFMALLLILPLGLDRKAHEENAQISEVTIEKVRHLRGDGRPFSWYYHDKFEYYYPSGRYDSCNWIYTNGTYTYTCN